MRAARQRAASEREQRIERAIEAMNEIDKSMAGKSQKRQADTSPVDTTQDETTPAEAAVQDQCVGEQTTEQPSKRTKQTKKPKEPRVSTTDHEARVMKMADGGFRPAFNAQLAVDTGTMIITGVDLINSGSDMNQMLPMHEQHQDRYSRVPEQSGWPMGDLPSMSTSSSSMRGPPRYSRRWSRPRANSVIGMSGCPPTARHWASGANAWAPTRPSKSTSNERPASSAPMRICATATCSASTCVACARLALAHNLKRMMALSFAFAA